jgi:hypothetical protein
LRVIADKIFMLSLIWLTIIVLYDVAAGPRVFYRHDGMPLDDKKEVMDRQFKYIIKALISPLTIIGYIGIIVSIMISITSS